MSAPSTSPHRPFWNASRVYAAAAIFFLGVATLGSLVPFEYQPKPFETAFREFQALLAGGMGNTHISRVDWLSNLLLFVPVGYCLLGMIATERSIAVAIAFGIPCTLLTSVAASLAIEFVQLWFPMRTPAVSDIVAQTLGMLVGVGTWLTVGRTLPERLRVFYRTRRAFDVLDYYLVAYFLLLTFFFLYPLDLSVHPGQLLGKYRRGLVQFRPFGDWQPTPAGIAWLVTLALCYIPVGMLANRFATPPEQPRRTWAWSLGVGLVLVGISSVGQVLVVSRHFSTTTLILAAIGVVVGISLARRGVLPYATPDTAATLGFRRRRGLFLASAAVYTVLVFAALCAPFDWLSSAAEVRPRLEGLVRLPFDLFYRGSPFNAAKEIVRKGLLFIPIGCLLGMFAASFPRHSFGRRASIVGGLALVSLVAVAIELTQALMKSHYPDSTDSLLYASGAAAALWVTMKLLPELGEEPSANNGSEGTGVSQ